MEEGSASTDARREQTFTGFYMVNVITKITKENRAGYALASFGFVAIPAIIFYITGLQPFNYVSIMLFGGVFLFLLLSRWINNIALNTCHRLVEKTKPSEKKGVVEIIQRLLAHWFNPWWHLISGIIFISVAAVLALLFGHLEWLYPATIILGFFTGISIWIMIGTIYFWHNLSTEVIGSRTPARALEPDRMGGFRFVADHIVTWTIIESLRLAYVVLILMTILWTVELPLAQTYFLIFFFVYVGIWFSGYFFVVLDLHRVFVKAKQEIFSQISSMLISVEEGVTSVARSTKPTTTWKEISTHISPYAQSILALKVFIDEYRYMRDWPIDLPLIFKVIFAILTPFLLLVFQWSIQFVLGIPVP